LISDLYIIVENLEEIQVDAEPGVMFSSVCISRHQRKQHRHHDKFHITVNVVWKTLLSSCTCKRKMSSCTLT